MQVLEFIHDQDHPLRTNVDRWVQQNGWPTPIKCKVYEKPQFPDLTEFDLLILHGGSQNLWKKHLDPWLYEELNYIKQALAANKKIIGFCLGSQLLAEALGGCVFEAVRKEVGWHHISLYEYVKGHVLLEGLSPGFVSFLWHSDHYEISEHCMSLAYTLAAPHQIIAGRGVPAVGFQFHPEYTKDNLREYYTTCYPEIKQLQRDIKSQEQLIADLEWLDDTMILFEKLMTNVMTWFQQVSNNGRATT